jgi:HK97 family phage portal protein
MKLFGFNITRSQPAPAPAPAAPAAPVSKGLTPLERFFLANDPEPNTAILTNAYEQVVWVYRAINILAEQIANVPFLFSRGERGREKLITSGPLLDFYERPHPRINRFQYWEYRVLWLMLRGECFRLPIFSDSLSAGGEGRGEVARSSKPRLEKILFLDPAHFQPVIKDGQLMGWRYTNTAANAPVSSQIFLPEEVWFEKLPNPFNQWRGFGPLQVVELACKSDYASGAFMKGLIENNADLGLIVRTSEQLDETQREQLTAALRSRKRQAGTPDRPLLLWSSAEIIKPQLSSADLQFLENRKFSRAEICAAFGVPEELITATDHAKYDVMQGARLNFIENRIAPLCARLEAEEQGTVKVIDPTAVGWFDLDSLPIMQSVRRARLVAAKVGFDMGVPFNELNRAFDLGFKPLPHGDDSYLPSNLQKLGGPAQPTLAEPPPARRAPESEEIDYNPLTFPKMHPLAGGTHGYAPIRKGLSYAEEDAILNEIKRRWEESKKLETQATSESSTPAEPVQNGDSPDAANPPKTTEANEVSPVLELARDLQTMFKDIKTSPEPKSPEKSPEQNGKLGDLGDPSNL